MADTTKTAVDAAKSPRVTPTNTQYLNLADYMYNAYSTPYSTTGLRKDIGFAPLKNASGKDVVDIDNKTGLYGQAFVSTGPGPKEVVVAYEGTDAFGQSAAFTGAQIQDDAMIFNGTDALSFKGAASFARKVTHVAANQGIRKNEVFVTGHSLGAAEAEYAAAKTGLGGTTFASPGIVVKGHVDAAKITNYVDAADPVGNYGTDTALKNVVTTSKITHFGGADILTNDSTNSNGSDTSYNNEAGEKLLHQVSRHWDKSTQDEKLADVLAVGEQNLYDHDFHSVTQYADDLGVDLYLADGSSTSSAGFFPGGSSSSTATAKATTAEKLAADPLCFASGTRILTLRGEIAVQDLVPGDVAVTADGARRPIVWIGHRHLACRKRPEAAPILVAAHAFGDRRPARDLRLSPGHPVLVGADDERKGGVLVPIMCLVNGTSIRRAAADDVTYWHVELDAHDILLADGLPAESYLEFGDRGFFEGGDDALADPDFVVPGLAARCRPVAVHGPVVEAERRRLDAVFATRLTTACAWPSEPHDLFVCHETSASVR